MLQIFPILLNMRKLDRSVHSFRILDFEVHQSTMSYTFVKLWKECPFEVGCDMPEQNSQIILTLLSFCIWICHKQIYSNCHYFWSEGLMCYLCASSNHFQLKSFSHWLHLKPGKVWHARAKQSQNASTATNRHSPTAIHWNEQNSISSLYRLHHLFERPAECVRSVSCGCHTKPNSTIPNCTKLYQTNLYQTILQKTTPNYT